MMAAEPVGVERGVVVWSHARDLLRMFRPQMWVVLEDLTLDAEWRDGRLVASSSARLVAEHLHIDPGTAAAALRGLRDRGVAELCQTPGAAGRFGLASYTLQLPPGLEIVSRQPGTPHTAQPHMDKPHTEKSEADKPHVGQSSTEKARTDSAARPARSRRRAASPGQWPQGALDLGSGDS